jgi:hypothetical protein
VAFRRFLRCQIWIKADGARRQYPRCRVASTGRDGRNNSLRG